MKTAYITDLNVNTTNMGKLIKNTNKLTSYKHIRHLVIIKNKINYRV